MPEHLQLSGFADETTLAAIGYTKARLIAVLTENGLEATPERVDTLICHLVSTTQQAVAEELDEALQNSLFSRCAHEAPSRGIAYSNRTADCRRWQSAFLLWLLLWHRS